MILTTRDVFIRELGNRIEKECERLKSLLAHGVPTDFAEYRHYVGQHTAMVNVAQMIEDINSDNDGKDR